MQLAGLDLRHGVGEVVEHELRVAGEQRLRGRRAALERHVHRVDAGIDLEQLAGEVAGAAVAARAEGELARIGLGVGDEFLDASSPAAPALTTSTFGRHRDQRDRREVLDRVVRHRLGTGSG